MRFDASAHLHLGDNGMLTLLLADNGNYATLKDQVSRLSCRGISLMSHAGFVIGELSA